MAVSIERVAKTNAPTYSANDLYYTTVWRIDPFTINTGETILALVAGCGTPHEYGGTIFDLYYIDWASTGPNLTLNVECVIPEAYQPGVVLGSLQNTPVATGELRAVEDRSSKLIGILFGVAVRGVDRRASVVVNTAQTYGMSATSATLVMTKHLSASKKIGIIAVRATSPVTITPVSPAQVIDQSVVGPSEGNYLTAALLAAPGNADQIAVSWNIAGSYAFGAYTIRGKSGISQPFVIG